MKLLPALARQSLKDLSSVVKVQRSGMAGGVTEYFDVSINYRTSDVFEWRGSNFCTWPDGGLWTFRGNYMEFRAQILK